MKNIKNLNDLEKQIDGDITEGLGIITGGRCEDEKSQKEFDKKQKGEKPFFGGNEGQ